MKGVVPVAVGLAAGMAVGFSLGVMVTRHDRPAVVIRNGTDETLQRVMIRAELPKSYHFPRGYIPGVEGWSINDLPPHDTFTARMSSHGPMALNLVATKRGGRELPSEKVNITSQGVVFALISSDGISLQQYER
jgi:hypothetical protein